MRVLFIAPYVPSLIRVRPYNFIRFLSGLGHQITVVVLGADGPKADGAARDALLPFCQSVSVVPISKSEAAFRCLRSLPTSTPLWAAYCFSRAMDRALRQVLAEQTFDVAHVEHLRAAHFADVLRDRLPLVFDSVDCITGLQRQLMRATGRSALSRAVSWEEQAKLRRYEPRLAARYDRVLMTSRQDAACLDDLAAAQNLCLPIDVIPNGVDLDYFRPQPEVKPLKDNLVLSGKMSYAANHDAALFFCRDVFPLVRRECPGSTLTIAGSGPRTEIAAFAARPDSGITVTGRVDDMRPYLARAAVAVCPLRIGVGIQNKILEAMAMGKAVVTTPLAARALENGVGARAVRVAATPQEFASRIIDLIADPSEAQCLGLSARSYVEAHHNWSRAAHRVEEVYQKAIAKAS